jgi:hypothetical protein
MNIGAKNRLDCRSTLPVTLCITAAVPLQAQFMIAKDRMKI